MGKKLNEEEKKYIRDNKGIMFISELAIELGHTYEQIHCHYYKFKQW